MMVASASLAPAARAQSTFADVPDDHWAAAAVKRLAEAGIIEGFPGEAAAPRAAAAPMAKSVLKPARAKAAPKGRAAKSKRKQAGRITN